MAFFSKLFDSNQKQISKLSLYTEKVNALEDSVSKLSDDDIRSRISTIKKIGAKTIDEDIDKFIDEYIYEVFALTREASKRALNHRHFDVQILGGASLARGKLIELSTGEGKTLVATLALSLYALLSRGSHLVTVNDYLAKRDGEWAGFIYSFLGLSVGIITSNASYKFIKEDEFELFGKDINETKNYEKKLNGMHVILSLLLFHSI